MCLIHQCKIKGGRVVQQPAPVLARQQSGGNNGQIRLEQVSNRLLFRYGKY